MLTVLSKTSTAGFPKKSCIQNNTSFGHKRQSQMCANIFKQFGSNIPYWKLLYRSRTRRRFSLTLSWDQRYTIFPKYTTGWDLALFPTLRHGNPISDYFWRLNRVVASQNNDESFVWLWYTSSSSSLFCGRAWDEAPTASHLGQSPITYSISKRASTHCFSTLLKMHHSYGVSGKKLDLGTATRRSFTTTNSKQLMPPKKLIGSRSFYDMSLTKMFSGQVWKRICAAAFPFRLNEVPGGL